MKQFMALLALAVLLTTPVYSQQENVEFKPNGKPLALIFTNFHTDFINGESFPAFDLTRSYLGYEYNFSPQWYAKVVFDVDDPGAGRHQFSAYVKNAYAQYSNQGLEISFGMISTTQFKVSEKIWGYRYIEESYQDLYSFNASADIGFNIEYQFTDAISADFSVVNGEGYKRLQSDDILRPGGGVTLRTDNNIVARVYADYMGKDVKQTSLATFLAYDGEALVLGAEYNYQWNVDMADGYHMYGPSFYATYQPADRFKIFGRVDDLNSSTPEGETQPWQIDDDGMLVMAGVEFSPVKGIKLAPNYRLWSPDSETLHNVNSLFLNCEFKF